MKRLAPALALVASFTLTGCSISIGGPASPGPTDSGPVAPIQASFDSGQVVPGYAPGQFPPVPLFPLPDTTVVSTNMEKVRDKLESSLSKLPGIKVTAVQCGADGAYISADSSLVLYGDGTGSYVGPNGTYTRGPDGSETVVTDEVVYLPDGKGGGQYVNGDLSITGDGQGSGAYVDGELTITLDGRGGGSYDGPLGTITNMGDGSGTYSAGDAVIIVEADGSGSYIDSRITITNDGKGTAHVVSATFVGDVKADPVPPVLPLGKFPPLEQLMPKMDACGFVITLADGVMFDFDRSDIRPDASSVLDDLATAMKAINASAADVSGHTDSVGSDSYNLDLSERRAQSVVTALVQRGVTTAMDAKGYGEARPVAPNEFNGKDNPAGRQLNRRVEVFVRS